jgi:hypothetical protein
VGDIVKKVICITGIKSVIALVEELAPEVPPNRKKRIVNQILTLLDGQDRTVRMTPEALTELLMVHSSCVMDQQHRCPLLLSVRSLTWEINQFMDVANEEDKGFKRHSEMLAARPLNRVFECFNEELDDENRG